MNGICDFRMVANCFIAIVLLYMPSTRVASQALDPDKPYHDLAHFSKVFGKEKYYRLYLPEGYQQSGKRYPVIYFFHGWGGRHYMDPSAKLEYEMIKGLADKYQVILVMWDGNYEEEQPRPYNMGYHENITSPIQMKDYFPELIAHIDSTYRTFTDRGHRGIIGFSMGGMMSWFLAGKYPDKVCAAVNMTGSPEFFIGYPDNHTLLPLRHAFKNLKAVKIRLHTSTNGELVHLIQEVNKGAQWEGGLDYSYEQFRGGHMIDDPGETRVFETAMKYVADAFSNPLPNPDRWWHFDMYPEFEVWDYAVKTNKSEPGFVVLKRVSQQGFGITSTRWLPDGPPIQGMTAQVTTALRYDANANYDIVQYSTRTGKMIMTAARSDASGRLQLSFREDTEVGIYRKGDAPDLIVVRYELEEGRRYLRAGEENKLTLTLFNRGGETGIPETAAVKLIPQQDAAFTVVEKSGRVELSEGNRLIHVPFVVRTDKLPPAHAEPAWIRIGVSMQLGTRTFEDEVVLPVFFDVPDFDSFSIDDGTVIRGEAYGQGDGDGVATAGEAIMLYAGEHRLRLYTDDPYIETGAERLADEVIPSKWPDGFTQSSIVKISEKCPAGHVIEFLASYETKDFETIERKLTWRKVRLKTGRK